MDDFLNQGQIYSNSFYKLALERDAITYLPTTWTIVHPIDDVSPLQKFKKEELSRLNGEILLLVSYYDESFAQEVHQIHSYILENLNYDQKFIPAFYYDDEGNTILDHNNFLTCKNTSLVLTINFATNPKICSH